MARGVREPEGFAVGTDELVGHGVEAEVAGEREGGDDVGGGDEGVGGGVGVVTAGEVTVVGSDDWENVSFGEDVERCCHALELASPFFTSCLSH